MASLNADLVAASGQPRKAGRSVVARAVRSPRGWIGILLVLPVVLIAILGPVVAPYDPAEFVAAPFAGSSGEVPLGADFLGRDVLSRVLDGGRMLLILAFAATTAGVLIGTALGMVAAYQPSTDDGIMRVLDVGMAFPQLLLALLLLSIVGPKAWLICLAVAAIHVPQVARVIRAATLRVVEQDYVKFASSLGIAHRKILATEVIPNIMGPVMVESGIRLTYSIGIIASLAFLGLGLQPPTADWGLMINENRIGMAQNPWAVVAPVALIAAITVGVNLFTDAVAQSVLDGTDAGGVDDVPEMMSRGVEEMSAEPSFYVIDGPAGEDFMSSAESRKATE